MKIFIILLAAAEKEVRICIFPANQGGTSGACHPGPLPASPTPFWCTEAGFPVRPAVSTSRLPRHRVDEEKEPWRPSLSVQTIRFPSQRLHLNASLSCSTSDHAPNSQSCLNRPAWLFPWRLGPSISVKLYTSQSTFKTISLFHLSKCPLRLVLHWLWFCVKRQPRQNDLPNIMLPLSDAG